MCVPLTVFILSSLKGYYLVWDRGKWEPPCLSRAWFLGLRLSLEALMRVGVSGDIPSSFVLCPQR